MERHPDHAWYNNSWLWTGVFVLGVYLWLIWSPKPPPTTAQKLKGRWINVASPHWQPAYEFQLDSPTGGPLLVTFEQLAARMTGRWEVRQQHLQLTLTELPWEYRFLLWTHGVTVPWVNEFEIRELTDQILQLDAGGGPEGSQFLRYRRP